MKNDEIEIIKSDFGKQWNDSVFYYQARAYDDKEMYLDLPFNTDSVRFSREEAEKLRDFLNKFLAL